MKLPCFQHLQWWPPNMAYGALWILFLTPSSVSWAISVIYAHFSPFKLYVYHSQAGKLAWKPYMKINTTPNFFPKQKILKSKLPFCRKFVDRKRCLNAWKSTKSLYTISYTLILWTEDTWLLKTDHYLICLNKYSS